MYLLTLTLHHIICDGWSSNHHGGTAKDLCSASGRPTFAFAGVTDPVCDFVIWQKDFLNAKRFASSWLLEEKFGRLSAAGDTGDLPGSDDADRRSAMYRLCSRAN